MTASKFSYCVLETDEGRNIYRSVWVDGCPMPDTYFKGRPVYFGNLCLRGCDSYFESATYADDDTELDDDELYQLANDNADYICEQNMEHFGYWPD